jgi:hypothetical protein
MNSYILGSVQYQVTAHVVIAKLLSGSEVYVYKNGLLPAETRQTHIDELLEMGMITKVEV